MEGNKLWITIPWFGLLFIVASRFHSRSIIPQTATNTVIWFDNLFMTIAKVVLCLRTHVGAIRQACIKPL
ncbi:putative sulfate exporter family transporter [Paraglaciecola polaris]|uniref:putative sulfate exporter family transporter n=1 Tax=Paraglaciecola polaris TaxID=222814 RepID=UPI003898E222